MGTRRTDLQDFAVLRESLRALPPAGEEGFEGLLCSLFGDLTGRRFFLAAAGSQHGLDMGTGGLGGTWIAIEAKRYSSNTSFKKKDLEGELLELSLRSPRPDLWTLVATRKVSHQLVTDLRRAANSFGIEIEVIDVPSDRPGDLDFLCAAYPETTVRYTSDAVLPSLERLRRRPRFDDRVESLRERFVAPVLGFDHVRQSALDWFRGALATRDEARARLGQPLDLLSPAVHYVRRKSSESVLNGWWRSWEKNPRPVVLLGEEGIGKTWAAAAWSERHVEKAPETILLFVPSREISTAKPMELLCRVLEEVTGSRYSQGFWEKRLDNWFKRSGDPVPQFLIVIDGVNELPTFRWRDLFDRLGGSPWRDRVAVLVTSRPGFWREELLMPGRGPATVTLQGFDDSELDQALRAYDHNPSDFLPDLIPLLRKPRYLALAIRHHSRLEETGDFTVDRLLYEDWKDRVERKSGLTLTDDQFRDLLRKLAISYREDRVEFAQRDLENLLPRDATVDLFEILTGGLVTVEAGLGQSYKVQHGWLIHGMGLLLASELDQTDEAEIEETLAHFLEPHLEIDQEGDILAAAVLFALFTSDYSHKAKQALLHAWVKRQNHSQTALDHLRAYVPVAYADYLQVLEDSTLNRTLDPRAIERLEYALLAWRSLSTVEAALVDCASRWLSFVHPEGFPHMRPQGGRSAREKSENSEASQSLKVEIEKRAGVAVHPGGQVRILPEVTLEVTSSDRFSWLADSALYFLSALPDRLRLRPLRNWAFSRAVMGSPREWTQVAWLLRARATAEFERELLELVGPLLDDPSITRSQAGAELLSCAGTPEALSRIARLPTERSRIPRFFRDTRQDDPCRGRLSGWRRQDCEDCSRRDDLDDGFIAAKLAPHCFDPEFEFPSAAVPKVKSALAAINLSKVWSYRGRTSADGELERVEPALAVADPCSLIAAYRAVVRVQSRSDEEWKSLAYNLERVLPLLRRESEKSALRLRLRKIHQSIPGKNNQLLRQERYFFVALNADSPPLEQLEALYCRPSWATHSTSLLNILQPVEQADLRFLLDRLPADEGDALDSGLFFLLSQPDVRFRRRDHDFLCGLLRCEERKLRDVPSRNFAVQVILRSGDRTLLEKALKGGCLEPGDDVFFFERWRGERLLNLRTPIECSALRSGLGLATISYILSNSNRLGSDLNSFAEDVDAALRAEVKRRRSPLHPLFRVGFSVPYIQEVVRSRLDLVEGWMDLATQGDLDWSRIRFIKSTYLLYEAVCEALFLEGDARASRLYLLLREATRQQEFGFQTRVGQDLPCLLFRVDVDDVQSQRKEWFRACGGDAALLSFATVARQHGRDDCLFELVQECLSSQLYFDQAKGISLAGWCTGARFRLLLENFSAIEGSWLDSVREQALARSSREDWARFWLREYLLSRGVSKSFAAFRLFLRCVDRRYWAWGPEAREVVSKSSLTGRRRLRFLIANQGEIEKAIEDREKGLDKSFLCLNIPTERFSPWTGLPSNRRVRTE